MRITMIGPFGIRAKGTMCARALPLARALFRLGHKVRIIMPPWDSPEDSDARWHETGVEIINTSLAGAISPRQSPVLLLRLMREAARENPDILHCFKPIGYPGLVGQLVMMCARRPAVICDLDDLEGRTGWAGVVARFPFEDRLREWQERRAILRADALTVASHFLCERAVSIGAAPTRVTRIPNGCDVHTAGQLAMRPDSRRRFASHHNLPIDGLWVLWSTRLFETNLTMAWEILNGVLARNAAVYVLIAGSQFNDLPEEHASAFSLLSRVFGNRIMWLGWLPEMEWENLVNACDVAIMPLDNNALNRARCPSKLPRMMAWGLPVVAHDVGEGRAYLADGETGRLVPAGAVATFVSATLEILESPTLRKRLSENARYRAITEWTWDLMAEKLQETYLRAMTRNDSAKPATTRLEHHSG